MKSIIVLRHGEAEPSSSAGDHGRALTERGREDARRVGRFLARIGERPDAAMVSSARRAQETWAAVAAGAGLSIAPRVEDDLYMTTPEQTLARIQGADAGAERLLLVGHQPTWAALLSQLVGRCRFNLPPAGCGCVRFLGDRWEQVQPGQGWLMWFQSPEHLGDG